MMSDDREPRGVARSARAYYGRILRSETAYSLILVAPLVAWIMFVMAYPIFFGAQLAMTDIRLIGGEGRWVGLTNFEEHVLRDPLFWSSLRRSLAWTAGNAVLQGLLGIGIGFLLARTRVARRSMRVWVLLPWVVPAIALAVLWRWMLSATFGIVNYGLVSTGLTEAPVPFLGSQSLALPTTIFINSWRWFPFLAVIVLAGLLAIPQEEYEAARLDGAGFWQEFRYITLPYLKPTLVILGLMGILLSFNMFDFPWLLTEGGPSGETRTLPVLVYELAFRQYFLARAAAIGLSMMILLLAVLIIYFRVNRSAFSLFVPTRLD
jgi:multiple sugar transport system permease protein